MSDPTTLLTEHDYLAKVHGAITAQLDLMSSTYDSRVLAAMLLGRASVIYNGLRMHGMLDPQEICRIYEIAIEGSLNDDMELPPITSGAKVN